MKLIICYLCFSLYIAFLFDITCFGIQKNSYIFLYRCHMSH